MSSTPPRRTEERVAADDVDGRRALHRRGFRLEGRLRDARPRGDGWVDELIYARLAGDPEGPEAHRHVMNSVTPRKRLIAHALVRDEAGRVLLCETSFQGGLGATRRHRRTGRVSARRVRPGDGRGDGLLPRCRRRAGGGLAGPLSGFASFPLVNSLISPPQIK